MTNDSPPACKDPSAPPFAEAASDAEQIAVALAKVAGGFLAAIEPLFRALGEVLARPDVQARIDATVRTLQAVHERIEALESPGYAPYFERRGHSGFSARMQAATVRSLAQRHCEQSRDKRIALSTLHDLARRPRWHPALARQVDRLRDKCWDADFVGRACCDAGCPELEGELMELVRGTRGGDYASGPRLIEIAARIAPSAPSPRGRPMRPETVLHQIFLRWNAESGGRRAYTYGPVQDDDDVRDDFIDDATAATRIELRRPSFNPVAARRAERRRGTTKLR